MCQGGQDGQGSRGRGSRTARTVLSCLCCCCCRRHPWGQGRQGPSATMALQSRARGTGLLEQSPATPGTTPTPGTAPGTAPTPGTAPGTAPTPGTRPPTPTPGTPTPGTPAPARNKRGQVRAGCSKSSKVAPAMALSHHCALESRASTASSRRQPSRAGQGRDGPCDSASDCQEVTSTETTMSLILTGAQGAPCHRDIKPCRQTGHAGEGAECPSSSLGGLGAQALVTLGSCPGH